MGNEATRRATYQDVLDAPDHVVAEVIDGVLHTHARPRLRHASVGSKLGAQILDAFRRDRSAPGGYVVLDEPELHLGAEPDIIVPDIAAWRIDRYPNDTDDPAFVTVSPDWVAEILSKSTARLDRGTKLPLYAREGVAWAWLVDADIEVIEVYRSDAPGRKLHGTFAGRNPVRAPPFDAIELDLEWIWGNTPR